MKLKWEQISEKFYNLIVGEENFGIMYQGKNGEWVLSIPGLSIYHEEQSYNDLKRQAEKITAELFANKG
jgi:hypothetical protein